MKIAVLSTPIFQLGNTGVAGYAGLEQIAWLQAKGLAALGHQVMLVAPDGSECPGVQIVPCGPAGQVHEHEAYGGFPEIRGDGEPPKPGEIDQRPIIRRQHGGYWQALLNADVVIDHTWNKWAYSLKAEGVLKAPILGWMHAPVKTMYSIWPPRYPMLPPVEKPCAVCISQDQASHHEAIHDSPARVSYNGIDPEFYKPIEGVKRTDRFLFLARFSTIKGPDLAIEACLKAGVGLDLVGDTTITGEPGFYDHCRRLAEQTSPGWDRSKGKQIIVHGGCSRGETVMWFSKAHCLLHPNQRFREPFGLAPVEAMACGCPVIAWDYGAMRETVVDNRGKPDMGTGVLVRSFDELVDVVRRAGRMDTSDAPMDYHRAFCRENALRFTVDRMVKRCEDLCREAVETGGW